MSLLVETWTAIARLCRKNDEFSKHGGLTKARYLTGRTCSGAGGDVGPNLALPSRGERDHPPGIGKRVRHWGSGRAPRHAPLFERFSRPQHVPTTL